MEAQNEELPLYLGFDLSTQSLKVVLISDEVGAEHLYLDSIVFARDLPQYATDHGMHADGATVTSPVSMWLEALDMGLSRLRDAPAGKLLPRVRALSCAAQQHGTVYWRKGAADALKRLSTSGARATLLEELGGAFARRDCPIWADSSAVEECERLEKAFGGPLELSTATGSAGYPRFSGAQIARFKSKDPAAYASVERISLVSNFVTTVLTGAYTPIDQSDASGMNLMGIVTRDWSQSALAAIGDDKLREKLGGQPVGAHTVVGKVSAFCTAKYALPQGCLVVSGSGDNPNSNAGLGLTAEAGQQDVAVSLGTSDTAVGLTSAPAPQLEGHVMVNAVDPASYFVMLVYKNGALCRERARDDLAGGTWEGFGRLLGESMPGNGGNLGLFLQMPEITPQIGRTGKFFVGPTGEQLASLTPAQEARAVVEGRFLSMRARLQTMGISKPTRVFATGGGSSNAHMMQILADVFGVPVYVGAVADAAAVGAALRAKHGYLCHHHKTNETNKTNKTNALAVPFSDVIGPPEARGMRLAATPDKRLSAVYDPLLTRFREFENSVKSCKLQQPSASAAAVSSAEKNGEWDDVKGKRPAARNGRGGGSGEAKRAKLAKGATGSGSGSSNGAGASTGGLSYKAAGVDIAAGDALVERIKPACKSTRRPGVDPELGGFGSVFDLGAAGFGGSDTLLVGAVDGVGTKLKVAQTVGRHGGVGVDLVAMCVNDLVCQGAEPLFFLDYYATGGLAVDEAAAVIDGIAEGCRQANCGLVGGETAEMPSMYPPGEYDLAGFVVGAVRKNALLPRNVHVGDVLLGLRSSGVHSNGFSLVRKIIEVEGLSLDGPAPFDPTRSLAEALLTPTKIYVRQLMPLLQDNLLHAAAHVSKGGVLEHLARVLPPHLSAAISLDDSGWTLPPVFAWIRDAGILERKELLSVFNCGVGMVLVTSHEKLPKVKEALQAMGEDVLVLGKVENRPSSFAPQVMVYGRLRDTNAGAASPLTNAAPKEHERITYSSAGVHVSAMKLLTRSKILPACRSTQRPGCQPGGGSGASAGTGDAGLFDLAAAGYGGKNVAIVGATDGVGTKLKVAQSVGQHAGVGIDLVAMCVNDLLVQGAEPLFFLDYYATGTLAVDEAAAVVESIAEGCRQANCGLVDGETAEMPSMYPAGEYDLAGFSVGAVLKERLLPSGVAAGDVLLGLRSSGVHSNGFSLVRKVVERAGVSYTDPAPFDSSKTLAEALLTPTRIYVKVIMPLLKAGLLRGMVHITGGGITENTPRVLPADLTAEINLSAWELPPVFEWMRKAGDVEEKELLRTFNCGVGMILIVAPGNEAKVRAALAAAGETGVIPLGTLVPRNGAPVVFKGRLRAG